MKAETLELDCSFFAKSRIQRKRGQSNQNTYHRRRSVVIWCTCDGLACQNLTMGS